LPISYDRIKVIVKDGWITLEGAVEWQYQKTTAENAVRKVKGVKGVTNVIGVKPKIEPSELQRKIMEAFKRNAELDAQSDHRRSERQRGDTERHRSLLDRARGSRACRLVGARHHQGRRSDCGQSLETART
jgi:hypothetical protein